MPSEVRDLYEWNNHDTGKKELNFFPTTDEEAMPYIPYGSTRAVYRYYRSQGKSVGEAMSLAMDKKQTEK